MKPAIARAAAGALLPPALAALLLVVGAPGVAQARATLTIRNLDGAGQGFNDPSPAAPVGGNDGRTVGEQRMKAFRYAADLWGQVLDSAVPIVIDASFAPLACNGSQVTLGQAASGGHVTDVAGLPSGMWVPIALADHLTGRDLAPGEADIVAQFNGAVRECTNDEIDWYYGFDGNAGDLTDLVSTILHELAHGLGFSSLIDPRTGVAQQGRLDVFSAHVFDIARGQTWSGLSAGDRVASASNARGLVWDGANVARAAAQLLARGAPSLRAQPAPGGLRGHLAEAEFGSFLSDIAASGRLVVARPTAGCGLSGSFAGAVALFAVPACAPIQQADAAETAGAVAALMTDGSGLMPPSTQAAPFAHRIFSVSIPALGISDDDVALLAAAAGAGAVTVELSADATRLVGADAMGRPYLYASDPILASSTVSHWDPLARPDLLEEPESQTVSPHDLRMELALLRDIGWRTLCGNGTVDAGEACDDGPGNSDSAPDACRTTCVRARCGDGVIDQGEQCDAGPQNGVSGQACRADCTSGPTGSGGQIGGGTGGGSGSGSGGDGSGSGGAGGGGGGGGGCGCGIGRGSGGERTPSAAALALLGLALVLGRARRRRAR